MTLQEAKTSKHESSATLMLNYFHQRKGHATLFLKENLLYISAFDGICLQSSHALLY